MDLETRAPPRPHQPGPHPSARTGSALPDTVVAIHAVTAVATLPALLVAAAWGVLDYRRGAALSRCYDRALWAVQAIISVQVVAGVVALLFHRWPARTSHLVLGSAASLLPWLCWQVARRDRRISLYLALTCAASLTLAFAAILTGRGRTSH